MLNSVNFIVAPCKTEGCFSSNAPLCSTRVSVEKKICVERRVSGNLPLVEYDFYN